MEQQSWIGQTINDRYVIQESIGHGGMSSVYKGLDTRLQRPVAVKVIHSYLSHNPVFTKRFEREAAAVAQLRHANIVQVYDFDINLETYFMVMEFVDGITLRQAFKQIDANLRERYTLAEIISMMTKLCDAVGYANARGLIHRDLKPANVLLTRAGEPILTDFGVAKPIDEPELQGLTNTGAIMGTVAYMAPELVRGDELDQRVDVYALGVILYELLYGVRPYMGDSAFSTMMKHLHDPVPVDREMRVDLPPAEANMLRTIIQKSLHKDRNQRFFNAFELQQALFEVKGGQLRTRATAVISGEGGGALSANGEMTTAEWSGDLTPLMFATPADKRARSEQQISTLEEALVLDLLQEKPLADLMELRARRGEFLQALRQYRLFQKRLEEELGLAPSPELVDLQGQIMSARMAPPNNLNPDVTSFIGRRQELTHLTHLLVDPAYRLITVLGGGGVGKTRLARALIKNLSSDKWRDYLHGAIFVPLADAFDEESMLYAFANAFNITLNAQKPVEEQIITFLQDRELLVIADNFEHLTMHSHIIFHFLDSCPKLTWLVTSRHRLNLPGEHVYPLMGLKHNWREGEVSNTADLDDGPLLFIQSARRINPHFKLAEGDLILIYNICELVDGVPLAIELAASWVRLLTSQEILDKLMEGYDLLKTEDQVTATRHRNLRSVFKYSWDLLSAEEQAVLAALSVFRGRFDQRAADAVAGGSIEILSGLVDKSLIKVEIVSEETETPYSRVYTMHEMVRRYAYENLQLDPAGLKLAESGLIGYYSRFLDSQTERLKGSQSREAWEEIYQNMDNIVHAVHTAVSEKQESRLYPGFDTLHNYYIMSGLNLDGVALFSSLVGQVYGRTAEQQKGWMAARGRLASLYSRLSDYERTSDIFEDALPFWQKLDTRQAMGEIAFLYNTQAYVFLKRGEFEAGLKAVEQAMDLYTELGDTYGMAMVTNQLGVIQYLQAKYPDAMATYEKSLALFEEIGDNFNTYRIKSNMGLFYFAMQQYEKGRELVKQDLEIARLWNNKGKIAIDLLNLAWVDMTLGRYDDAIDEIEESIVYHREVGDIEGEATALLVRADISWRQGYGLSAQRDLLVAIRKSYQVQALPKFLECVAFFVDIMGRRKNYETALTMAIYVRNHPQVTHIGLGRINYFFNTYSAEFDDGLREKAETESESLTEDDVLETIQTLFDPNTA